VYPARVQIHHPGEQSILYPLHGKVVGDAAKHSDITLDIAADNKGATPG
jgi:hypothetical protein